MNTVIKHYHVGEDGILHLDVPIGLSNVELEVTVTFQPVTPIDQNVAAKGKSWAPGFFEETYGICKNDPIVIDSEGIIEDDE